VTLDHNHVTLLQAALNTVMDIKLSHPTLVSALFMLLEVVESRDLRETICLTFKVISPHILPGMRREEEGGGREEGEK
jgi:hypothetical protein